MEDLTNIINDDEYFKFLNEIKNTKYGNYYFIDTLAKDLKLEFPEMPTLKAGECFLIGDAVVIPSIVQIDECENKPSSNDIPYFELWKEKWKELNIGAIKEEWCN